MCIKFNETMVLELKFSKLDLVLVTYKGEIPYIDDEFHIREVLNT